MVKCHKMTEKIKILKDSTERQDEEDNILERHPDWPQLDVQFYFASHGNARDMEGVAEYLADADVLLYENTGRTPAVRKLYDRIAQHPNEDVETVIDTNTYKGVPLRGHATEPLVRGLYGSGKAVGTLDIGKSRSDVELETQAYKDVNKMASRDLNYRAALMMTKNNARDVANTQAEREERMVENFEDEMEFIFKTHPDLLEMPKVKVLVTIGSFHTSLGRRFDKHGVSSTRDFSEDSSYKYGYRSELQRDFMYGVTPSDELLKNALSEDIVNLIYEDELAGGDDMRNEEMVDYICRYVSGLSDEDHEKLHALYRSGNLSIDNINNSISAGMKLANTGYEIEKANKNHRIRAKRLGKAARH